MNKKFFLSLLVFFLLSLASASSAYYNLDSGDDVLYKEKISKTYYDADDAIAVTRTIQAYYDNDDRYSTRDYRWGYSYRDTYDYWRDNRDYEDVRVLRFDDDSWSDSKYRRYDDSWHPRYRDYDNDYRIPHMNGWNTEGNRIKIVYAPAMRSYEARRCYDYEPKGKLFYISCDGWLY